MAHTPNPRPWIDLDQYIDNHVKILPKISLQYAGQHVAWSLDGLRIVAGAADEDQLLQQLREAGIGLDQVVLSYIPDPDVSQL
jgi:hypothetical protein